MGTTSPQDPERLSQGSEVLSAVRMTRRSLLMLRDPDQVWRTQPPSLVTLPSKPRGRLPVHITATPSGRTSALRLSPGTPVLAGPRLGMLPRGSLKCHCQVLSRRSKCELLLKRPSHTLGFCCLSVQVPGTGRRAWRCRRSAQTRPVVTFWAALRDSGVLGRGDLCVLHLFGVLGYNAEKGGPPQPSVSE